MNPLARILRTTPHRRETPPAMLLLLLLAPPNGLGAGQPASPSPIPAPLPPLPASFPSGFSAEDRRQVERDLKRLTEKLASLRAEARDFAQLDHLADTDLSHKGIVWALRYETTLPRHQERVPRMHDSVDYAANAGVVPAIAGIGDRDVFFQAHVIMGEAMAKEGLPMPGAVNVAHA